MKTKELIKRLQEADPDGEIEVNINGEDPYLVETLPGYYDGSYQTLIHAEHRKPYYTPIGVTIRRRGKKVIIKTLSIEDILFDNPDCLIQYDSEETRERHEKCMENKRQEIKQEIEKIDKQIQEEQKIAFEKDREKIMNSRKDRLKNAAEFLQRIMCKETRSDIGQLVTQSGEPLSSSTAELPANKNSWDKIVQIYKMLEEIKNENN